MLYLMEVSSVRRKNGCCTREERRAGEMSEKRQESLGSGAQGAASAFLRRGEAEGAEQMGGAGCGGASSREVCWAGLFLVEGHGKLRVRMSGWGWRFGEKGESGKES